MGRQLGLARARAQSRLLWAIAGTTLIVVIALAAALGWLSGAMRSAIVAAVEGVGPSARTTILEIPATADSAAQADQVARLLSSRFGASLQAEVQPAEPGGTARWTLTIDQTRFDPWATEGIALDLHDLAVLAKETPGLAPEGASTEGGLSATLTDAAGVVRAAQAVVPVPLALVAAAGLVASLQLARLLGAARVREAAVLAARGRSRRSAQRGSLAEGLIVTAIGALVGWLGAAGVVAGVGGGYSDALARTMLVPIAAALGMGITVSVAARRAEDAGAGRTGRARGAVSTIGAGLLLLAAAVFLWLLATLGRDAGEIMADPWSLVVVALGPALGLAAVATVALLVLAPAASGVAHLAARSRGLGGVLSARTTARQVAASGAVVAILALAAGGAVLAGAALGTWRVAADATGVLVAGADARGVAEQQVDAAPVAKTDAASGVDAAAAVLTDRAVAGGAELDAVLLAEQSAATVIAPVPAAGIDPVAIAAALGSASVGEALDPATTGVQATFGVTPSSPERATVPASGAYAGKAWFVDALGTPVSVPLEIVFTPLTWSDPINPDPGNPDWVLPAEPTSGTLTASAALPEGRAPWTFVGLGLGFSRSEEGYAPALEAHDLSATGAGELAWPSAGPWVLNHDAPSLSLTFAPVPAAVPAVITTGLAAALGLDRSDRFELTLDASTRTIPVEIALIVPAVPGSTDASAALLPLDQATLVLVANGPSGVPPDEVWASGPDAARALAAALPAADVIRSDDGGRLSDALTVPWWIATGAAAALAGIALIAGAVGLARVRAGDVFVLAAQGVTAQRQARWRAREHIVLAAGAVIVGAVLGIPLAFVAVPALTRAAVPGVPAVLAGALEFGLLPLAIVVAVIALATVAAIVSVSAVIRRQANAGRLPEAG